MSTVERELSEIIAEIRAHDEAKAKLVPKRDKLIRKALQANTPRARIIGITELSPARIDQIRRGARL